MIRKGQTSNAVGAVQRALNIAMPKRTPLAVDGIFGPKTHAGVVAFQTATGRLTPDGIVGPRTLERLFQGVELTVRTVARPKAQAPGGVTLDADRLSRKPSLLPGRLTPPDPFPVRSGFVPWASDPRDAAWHEANRKWLAWLAQPFPKGPAPPLPPLLPPSLSLPSPPPPPWLTWRPPPSASNSWSFPIDVTGGTYELSGGFKLENVDGKWKLKPQEAETKMVFLKVPVVELKTLEVGVESSVTTTGKIDVEAKLDWKPAKLKLIDGDGFNLALMPLVSTAINTGGGEVFAGGKAVLTTTIKPWGAELEIGGKLGSKLNLKIADDGRIGASAYPLAGMGTIEIRWGGPKKN